MEPTPPAVGAAIKQATDFMREVYREVSRLFEDVDRVLKDSNSGWCSANFDNVFLQTQSLALENLEHRLPRAVGRLYAADSTVAVHHAAVEVHLSPPSGASEAWLVLAVASFKSALSHASAQAEYRNSDFAGLLLKSGTVADGTLHEFTPAEHPRVFPNAEHLRVGAWPLASMNSRDHLRKTLVETLLKAVPVDHPPAK
ncbi:hypothetical protein D7Y13_20110 [Corallococcus praedator]|uniref:Uncharacterized protein n=1 Tax=Corallococcus praedator TaxID=2316724 RepID=A0ABX9QI15_9BACT|nr:MULTISPECIES: hypothetical protein [Corallococcus]RKH31761.1 hypothetical protein D7X75_18395 [Corallococcus sp. CA031C]RKI06499.1 hypothetical protein D7Y13_20110 [Corallococcus praedator]